MGQTPPLSKQLKQPIFVRCFSSEYQTQSCNRNKRLRPSWFNFQRWIFFLSAYFLSILTASLYLMFDTGGQYGYLLQLARDPLRQMNVVQHRCLVWWSTRWTQRRRRVTARDSTVNAQNIHSFVFYSGKPFLSRDFLRECRLFYRFDIQLISCSVRHNVTEE